MDLPSHWIVLVVAAACLAAAQPASAQPDNQLWLDASVRHAPLRNTSVQATALLRLQDGASRLGVAGAEVEGRYRLRRWLRATAGLRYAQSRDRDDALGHRLRLHGAGRVRGDLGPMRLSYRLAYQASIRADATRHTVRNRAKIIWLRTRRLELHMAWELFHRLGDGEVIRLWALRTNLGGDLD
ncbi:MAG: DUF2490 domain-containing protein, partial [Myxococcota bacterium]